MKRFKELYATERSAHRFLELAATRDPVDMYARLQFSEVDINRIKGEFFGYSYYDDPDPGDPFERYISPEGKAMLLFSKSAPTAA